MQKSSQMDISNLKNLYSLTYDSIQFKIKLPDR